MSAVFDTRAELMTLPVPSGTKFVMTGGRELVGDGGASMMKLLTSAPSPVKPWHTQSGDGQWWQLFTHNATIDPRQLGYKVDATWNGDWSGTDNYSAFQASIDFCETANIVPYAGGTVKLPPGAGFCSREVDLKFGVTVDGHGCGMQYAGFNPLVDSPVPNIGASWIVYPNNFNGTAMVLRGKSPFTLTNFGLILPGGSQVAHHIYVDNFVAGDTKTYIANFKTKIDNLFLYGGGQGIRLLNCVLYDINRCYIYGFISCGIYARNDGTGAPFPIIDGGDARMRNCHLMNAAAHIGGSTGILIEMQGGLWLENMKILGTQFSIVIRASATAAGANGPANETGVIKISDLNAEAWSVACIVVEQTKQGAKIGEIDICGASHMNGGVFGTPEQPTPQVQGAVIIRQSQWGENYTSRGGIDNATILYVNGAPDISAIQVGAGLGYTVRGNKFAIPGNNHCVSTFGTAQKTIVVNNGLGQFLSAPDGPYIAGTIVHSNDWN